MSSRLKGAFWTSAGTTLGSHCQEHRVELARDVAFEAADDLRLGPALCCAALHVGSGSWIPAHAADGQQVQRTVALAIPAPVESIAGDLAGRSFDGRDSDQVGECTLAG